jgi:hydroxymethylbilane synthase
LVHSLKDVPTVLPPEFEIGATPEREDPRDVFIVRPESSIKRIQDLPEGAVVGTSSVRRTAQIARSYPHLEVKDCRGNIDTRLAKLDAEDSPYDAIILAAAGVLRINLAHRITQYLDSSNGMLYAVGQGAIGVENRIDDQIIKTQLEQVNHIPTYLAINAERGLLRYLEGGCSAPLGVESTWLDDGQLQLRAIVVSTNGKESAEADLTGPVRTVEEAETFGVTLAKVILDKGADKILSEIKAKRPTLPSDLGES